MQQPASWQKDVAMQRQRSEDHRIFLSTRANECFSDVKHVIGVVSGKGGVGKSFRNRLPWQMQMASKGL